MADEEFFFRLQEAVQLVNEIERSEKDEGEDVFVAVENESRWSALTKRELPEIIVHFYNSRGSS